MQEVLHVVGGSTPLDHPFFFSISIPFYFLLNIISGDETQLCVYLSQLSFNSQ